MINCQELELLEKLKQFYLEICKVTINHNVVKDQAVIFAKTLDTELCKVDPDWVTNYVTTSKKDTQ